MFKAIRENKIIAISDTNDDFLFMVIDRVEADTEHTTADYIQVQQIDTEGHSIGEYKLKTSPEAIEELKAQVKAVRAKYFEKYVDYYQQKPWLIDEMPSEEVSKIKGYREYLKDYTATDKWWEQNPLTYEEWVVTE